jgi:hypothetical protein
MERSLGQIVQEFDAAVRGLRAALARNPDIEAAVFSGAESWLDLLTYKLVPHLEGEGCLVVAVAGGTNSGKSTVFNLLLGRDVSPAVTTAAATRHPVIAGNARRVAQCLEGKLVPEFAPKPLENPKAIIENGGQESTLFVAEARDLPDRLVLLDTPDVDSIEKTNWAAADSIRAAGDVIVAVLTGEKYRDERVVAFFREALAAGREVVPLMNKADPADDFAVARRQLVEFAADVGFEPAAQFVVPHDFGIGKNYSRPIGAIDGEHPLGAYLESLDVAAIKERVYRGTVQHLADSADAFLVQADETAQALRRVADEFEGRAEAFARRYDPAPGAAVGGLFHEFVQSRRGPIRRAIGTTSTAIVKGTTKIARTVYGGFRKRATLDPQEVCQTEAEIQALHRQMIEQITRNLARSYVDSARNLKEPAAQLVAGPIRRLNVDEAVKTVSRQTLRSESISKEFRDHANRTLETWWTDHKGRRRVLEGLDAVLAIMPAAIAAPLSLYTGGVGVPETLIVAGPLAEQFVARVIEYQFGDAMFDFLSPWRNEQQQNLMHALHEHVTGPALRDLYEMLEPLEGEAVDRMRELLAIMRGQVVAPKRRRT